MESLIRSGLQSNDKGVQKNSKVQPNAPVFDVPEVVLDALCHKVDGFGFASQAVDLRPASQARFYVVPIGVFRDDLLIL